MKIRIKRTETGVQITNEGEDPIMVGPYQVPEVARPYMPIVAPGGTYETIGYTDMYVQTLVES